MQRGTMGGSDRGAQTHPKRAANLSCGLRLQLGVSGSVCVRRDLRVARALARRGRRAEEEALPGAKFGQSTRVGFA